MLSVVDGCVLRLDPVVAALLVGIDDRPIRRDGFGQKAMTGGLADDHQLACAYLEEFDWVYAQVQSPPRYRSIIRHQSGNLV